MQTPSIRSSSSQNFDINTITGLSEQEVTARLAKEGYNELPSTGRRGIVKVAFEIVREPMLILLIAGGIIYLLLEDTYIASLRRLLSHFHRRSKMNLQCLVHKACKLCLLICQYRR